MIEAFPLDAIKSLQKVAGAAPFFADFPGPVDILEDPTHVLICRNQGVTLEPRAPWFRQALAMSRLEMFSFFSHLTNSIDRLSCHFRLHLPECIVIADLTNMIYIATLNTIATYDLRDERLAYSVAAKANQARSPIDFAASCSGCNRGIVHESGGSFHGGGLGGLRGGFGGSHPGFGGGLHQIFGGGSRPKFDHFHQRSLPDRDRFAFRRRFFRGRFLAGDGYDESRYCHLTRHWVWNGWREVHRLVPVCR